MPGRLWDCGCERSGTSRLEARWVSPVPSPGHAPACEGRRAKAVEKLPDSSGVSPVRRNVRPPNQIQDLCRCGVPLLVRYDLDRARRHVAPEGIARRARRGGAIASCCVPRDGNEGSLGEGMSPLSPSAGLVLGAATSSAGTDRTLPKPWQSRPRAGWQRDGQADGAGVPGEIQRSDTHMAAAASSRRLASGDSIVAPNPARTLALVASVVAGTPRANPRCPVRGRPAPAGCPATSGPQGSRAADTAREHGSTHVPQLSGPQCLGHGRHGWAACPA